MSCLWKRVSYIFCTDVLLSTAWRRAARRTFHGGHNRLASQVYHDRQVARTPILRYSARFSTLILAATSPAIFLNMSAGGESGCCATIVALTFGFEHAHVRGIIDSMEHDPMTNLSQLRLPGIDRRRRVPIRAIRAIANIIAEKFDPEKIVLFGSHAYGRPKPWSDVDLLFVMDTPNGEWPLTKAIRESLPPVLSVWISLSARKPR